MYQDIKKTSDRLDRYDRKLYSRKLYSRKKKKLCEELNVGEKVLTLAERLKKNSTQGKFHKQSVQISLISTQKMPLL